MNLDYYERICCDNDTKRDRLYKLLTVKEKSILQELTKNEKMLLNYNKRLIQLSNNNSYWERIMDERIERNLAYQEAYFAGKFEALDEMVLKMHDEKISLEIISKCTSLTIQEIKNIINSNKEN